ncbi:MAG: hypothetical protein ACXWV5_11135 [Flavitalea sp.]
MIEQKIDRNTTRLLISMVILYLVLICYISWDPRGNDQYWNLANVERVTDFDGVFKTNNIFPAGMPEDLRDLPRPWVQNRPVVYLVTLVNMLLHNTQLSWILSNFLFLVLTLVIMQQIIRSSPVSKKNYLFSSILLFVFPLNFYLVMQALPEQFNQLLVIVLVYILLVVKHPGWRPALAAIIAGLLMYQRDNYILLLFLIPVYLFIFHRKQYGLVQAVLFMAIMGLLYFIKPYILPGHTINHISSLSILSEVRPGNHNMINYLHPEIPQKSFTEIVKILGAKTVNALSKQFTIKGTQAVFMYTMNLLLIPFILLLFNFRRLPILKKKVVFLTAIFVAIHFATIFIFENQYRFSATLIPLLILCGSFQLRAISMSKIFTIIPVVVLVGCIGLDILIGYSNVKEAKEDKLSLNEYREIKRAYIKSKPVMVMWTDGKQLLPSYAWLPDPVYYFPADAKFPELKKVADKLDTDLYLVKKPGTFYNQVQPQIVEEIPMQHHPKTVLLRIKR